jgi:hypothetical protein
MLRSSRKLEAADLIAYVHDSSDTNSFSYISNLRVSTAFHIRPFLTMSGSNNMHLITSQLSLLRQNQTSTSHSRFVREL